jgi:transcriptional regulator with XRE-family HTH domain
MAALAAIRAASMGLIPPGEVANIGDPESVGRTLDHVQRAGIGRGLRMPSDEARDAEALAALLEELLEAMAASPVPETEWPAVERVLGSEQLAGLLGISVSSLRRYASGTRTTPDEVAVRLHFLALVVGDLAGSYNDLGIRRWFTRRRSQLDGHAPADLLQGSWDPEDAGPSRVRTLAAALLDIPAT